MNWGVVWAALTLLALGISAAGLYIVILWDEED